MAALAHGTGGEPLETRERILMAAGQLLARHGLSKLTLEDVARATGVTRQALYRYFSGKDELVIELFVAEMERTHYPVMRDMAKGKPTPEVLVRLFLKEVELARGYSLYDDLLAPGVVARMAELTFGAEK